MVSDSGAIAASVKVARDYAEQASAAALAGPSPRLAESFARLAHTMVDGLPTS